MREDERMGEDSRPDRPRVFITLGDGLAAGFGPWRLSAAGRRTSFAARIARRLGVPFIRPASEPSEILQQVADSRVELAHHLAVPGLDLDEVFVRRPTTPLLPAEEEGTALNLVLGLPTLLRSGARPPSLVEAAASHRPTHVLVCFGYDAAAEAARTASLDSLDAPEKVFEALGRLERTLEDARMAVLGVPDPTRTPFFDSPSLDSASHESSSGRRPSHRRGLRSRVREQNAALRRWARAAAAVYIDPDVALVDASGRREPASGRYGAGYFGVDRLYPNAAGHHRLALAALEQLEFPWQLAGPIDRLDAPASDRPSSAGGGIASPADEADDSPRGAPGVELLRRAERGRRPLRSERELTLELDGGASFCQIALVESRGRRRSLEKTFAGSPLGLAPLTGVVELCLGRLRKVRGKKRRRLRLGLPVALEALPGGRLRAPELLQVPLDDLELASVLAFEGWLDDDGRVGQLSGGVRLRSSFLDDFCAAQAPLPEPELAFELEVPPRGDAYHVDLRLRAAFTLPSARVPLPACGGDDDGADGDQPDSATDRRLLETGASQLLLYLRLTTLPAGEERPSREPRRRPDRPALESAARQVDLPTLAVLEGEYDLEAPELGGAARDERRLLGLTRLELGEPVGELQPLIATLESPSISRGERRLIGFDGEVRFPNRLWRRRLPTWRHERPSLGVVHRESGRLLGGLALAARSNSLPADVSCRLLAGGKLSDESGQLRLDLEGEARVELPAGTPFHLSGAAGELAALSHVLLRLRLEATGRMAAPRGTISGEERLLSTGRQLFSFRYALPPEPGERTLFEYRNHSAGGSFRLTCPLRLLFARSRGSKAGRSPDTVILEGLGTWREQPGGEIECNRHVIFISRKSRTRPYVAILVDGGISSNVEAGET